MIIVDIFPRVAKTGYHGDMTRTYLKGRATDAQKELYGTVFEAEQSAFKRHRSGKSASKIYHEVKQFFEDKGYPTQRDNGVPVGFIHGLGHGLGLAVHEPPRVNASGDRLKKGQVITVEPGLYYPGLGGARVEDVVRVRKGEPELLSKHGWQFYGGGSGDGLFVYDFILGSWLWTRASDYPLLYAFPPRNDWFLYFVGGTSKNRCFFVFGQDAWINVGAE